MDAQHPEALQGQTDEVVGVHPDPEAGLHDHLPEQGREHDQTEHPDAERVTLVGEVQRQTNQAVGDVADDGLQAAEGVDVHAPPWPREAGHT